ncbi:CLUMA_CG009337, isoform A [Clunio marinus]|uniref:CLUMA_CG009337, isoform A n=1 Tax=Clunio marinus TaxID=568069 RepID=A0A1J1I6S4_9DIPT|nr:CLUMA_CG009337, isoform A [Clunio marinus]
MYSEIDDLIQKNRSIEEDLKVFGLDKIEPLNFNHQNYSEWQQYEKEIRLSDVKVDVHKIQNQHKKLVEDLSKSQNSIKLLNECLATKVNESEIDKLSAQRKARIKKLESKQTQIDDFLLTLIKKI